MTTTRRARAPAGRGPHAPTAHRRPARERRAPRRAAAQCQSHRTPRAEPAAASARPRPPRLRPRHAGLQSPAGVASRSHHRTPDTSAPYMMPTGSAHRCVVPGGAEERSCTHSAHLDVVSRRLPRGSRRLPACGSAMHEAFADHRSGSVPLSPSLMSEVCPHAALTLRMHAAVAASHIYISPACVTARRPAPNAQQGLRKPRSCPGALCCRRSFGRGRFLSASWPPAQRMCYSERRRKVCGPPSRQVGGCGGAGPPQRTRAALDGISSWSSRCESLASAPRSIERVLASFLR